MKPLVIVLGMAGSMATGSGMSQSGSDVEVRVTETRSIFVPGEPIDVRLEMRNLTGDGIVKPIMDDWQVQVRDSDGNLLQNIVRLGEGRVWDFDAPNFETIAPGETISQMIPLQHAFLLRDEGTYSAQFTVRLLKVVGGQPQKLPPFESAQSSEYLFQVSSDSIVWEQSIPPLFFHIVDSGGTKTLRFYRGPFLEADAPFFSDYTIVGEVGTLTPPPELSSSSTVTEWAGWVGVKFEAPDGTKCAIVELKDDAIQMNPPIPIVGNANCSP